MSPGFKTQVLILFVSTLWTKIESQCSSAPCFHAEPSDPSFGIAGQDILLNWQFTSTVRAIFQKWSLINKESNTPTINILTRNEAGVTVYTSGYENKLEFKQNSALLVKNLSVADENYYGCTVDFEGGKSIFHKVLLNITVLPSISSKLPSQQVVTEGQSTTITCEAKARPPPQIAWYLNGMQITNSRFVVTTEIARKEGDLFVVKSSVNVTEARPEDNGPLTCKVQIVTANLSSSTNLTVYYSPRNTTLVSDRLYNIATLGEKSILTCTASGKPQLYYEFYKDGVLKENSTNNKYVILKNQLSDEGNYTCIPQNYLGKGPVASLSLLVRVPTKLLEASPSIQSVLLGSNVSLRCTMYGEPAPLITWKRINGTITSSGSITTTQISQNASFTTVQSILKISSVKKEDYGVYMCTGSNIAANTSHSITLDVQYPPFFIQPLLTQYNIRENTNNFQIVCHFRAKPMGSIVWYKDGMLLTTSVNETIKTDIIIANDTGTETKSTLTIKLVQKMHFGRYHCNVTNEQGSTSSSAQLVVDYAPYFVNEEPVLRIVNISDNTLFTCRVQSSPNSSIIWTTKYGSNSLPSRYSIQKNLISHTKQRTIIESSLTIFNVTKSDYGNIACRFENNIGFIEKNYTLVIQYPPENTTGLPIEIVKLESVSSYALSVTFVANPRPEVTWFINNTKINASMQSEVTKVQRQDEVQIISHLTLSSLSRTKIGNYKCKATNILGESVLETFLVINYIPTFLTILPPEIIYNTSQTALLSCEVISNPISTLSWFFGSTKESNTTRIRVLSTNVHQGKYNSVSKQTLEINNLNKSNSGNYTCEAVNLVATSRQITLLIVYYGPIVTTSFASSTNISETNQHYYLECTAEGSPPPKMKWNKNGVHYTTNVTEEILINLKYKTLKKSRVNFYNGIKRNHHGTYACASENVIATIWKTTVVNVWYVPEFTKIMPTRENRTVSQSIVITCEVRSHPSPKITWLKNNNSIVNGFTTVIVSKGATQITLLSNLTLTSLSKADTAHYICRASDVAGKREQTTFLDIQYAPVASVLSENITVNAEQKITLMCNVDANPPVHTYIWKKDENLLPSQTSSSIQITSASKSSTGLYQCTAINNIGQGPNMTFDVKVRVKPEVTKPVACNLTTKADNTRVYECSCDGTGYPTPSIRWTKFGSPTTLAMGTFLNFTVKEGVDGTYECRIKNSEGEVIDHIQIIVFTTQYGPWSAFQACNATCGKGYRSRTRVCNVPPCPGQLVEVVECNLGTCGAITGKQSDDLLFLYILIPIALFLLIFLIVWLTRITRKKDDQEPIVVPINGNLSKPPSIRSIPTKREIYLPGNNFGVLNAGYRPDEDITIGSLKKDMDTIEVVMQFGNEPIESDTDAVELATAASESPESRPDFSYPLEANGDIPDGPDYIPVPDYESVPVQSNVDRPNEIESWLGPRNISSSRREDDGDFYTAL